MLHIAAIDPARLKCSRFLKCVQVSTYAYRVAGDQNDYTVDLRDRLHPRCERHDGARHLCMHALAALRVAGEPSVLGALGQDVARAPHPALATPSKTCGCGQPLCPDEAECVFCQLGV